MAMWKQRVLTAIAGALLCSASASAQSATSITGTVRDASGGVLPGVTVEVASPALIERVRTTTTGENGQYRIIDLRPGTYDVTFALAGFNTVKREGVVLTTDFTAQVNIEMKVGAIEETLTVTGYSPVVDVQNAQVQQQITRETLDLLPTGRSAWSLAKVLPGITASGTDVGGSGGFQSLTVNVHGSKGDNVYQVDGMTVQSGIGNGTAPQYYNDGQFEEYTYTTSAIPAEVAYGGVRIQMTSRDGGNQFKGYGLGQYAKWQTDNYSSELASAGLRTPDSTIKIWDTQASLGGPIMRDKLWFFVTNRYNGGDFLIGNSSYRDPAQCTDLERPYNCQGVDDNWIESAVGRLTYQATPKNKIAGFYSKENKYRGHREIAAGVSPEATTPQVTNLSYSAQVKWTAPLSDRFLIDVGVSQYYLSYDFKYQDNVLPNAVAKTDLTLQQTWGARPGGFFTRGGYKRYYMGNMAYVTGTHNFKAGIQYNHATEYSFYDVRRGHVVQQYRNGVPASVLVDNTPVNNKPGHDEFGAFVQDNWTMDRLTISPGVRFDWFHPWVAKQVAPAGRWVPERTFDAINDLLAFTNVSPRVSAVYDVFGDGKTAVKVNFGQYIAIQGNTAADNYNPSGVLTNQRTWTDRNGDDIAQDNEIGPSTVSNFGTRAPRFQGDTLGRPKNYEFSGSIQREILPRIQLGLGFFRRTFLDIYAQDNTLVGASDYTPLTIADPRGNGQTITIYNLSPTKLGQTNPVDNNSKANREWWNGVELSGNGRIGDSSRVYAGITMGASSQNLCEVDDPNQLRYCERSAKWLPQYKLGGSMTLPWGVYASGTFSSFPGAALPVTYVVNRTVVPTLTQTSITVNLDNPSRPDRYADRQNQLDIRFAKRIPLGAKANRYLNAQFDVFNALNVAPILSTITSFGPTVYQPRTIMQGRLAQFGIQLYF
jgi:hypothetical protein